MKYANQVDYERKPRCRCGKICFDKRTALTKKNWLEEHGKERGLGIYPCPFSNTWHLTSKDKIRK